MTATINEINDIISTIASAIQEQPAATSEIAKNMGQASQGIDQVTENIVQDVGGIGEINQDIASVNTSAGQISSDSQKVAFNAEELQAMATRFNSIVGQFKGSLKNKLPILVVKSPALQGVKMQAYQEYAEFSQRGRAG